MIAIVDYGMGNLGSVSKGCLKCGLDARVVTTPREVKNARAIILPGVGAIGAAMKNLEASGMLEPIMNDIRGGKPFLGICLGLQMLFDYSEEWGRTPGMGIFPGKVVRFTGDVKVPHMGWNQVYFRNRSFVDGERIPDGSFFYFVHSYYVAPDDPDIVMTTTPYGGDFVSGVTKDNVTAVQFHPEKSQRMGLALIEMFGRNAMRC